MKKTSHKSNHPDKGSGVGLKIRYVIDKAKPHLSAVLKGLILLNLFFNFALLCLILITKFTSEYDFSKNLQPQTSDISAKYQIYRTTSLVELTFNSLTLEQKVGQMFMFNLPSTTLDETTKEFLIDYDLGGIVIMSNNIASWDGLTSLITNLQETSSIKLLIATDQEGGSVARIPWDEARFISESHIGIVDREDFAYYTGDSHAKALKQFAINLNLAPVLDIAFTPNSAMTARSLGADSAKVTRLGVQIIKAHSDEGILTCVKHYPGIGRSTTDSHLVLPVIDVSKEQLLNEELMPFKMAITEGIEVIMTGHALYPKIDPSTPSSLSKIFLTDILRNELGFDGIILTDDLNMKALASYPNKIIDAINAGSDMILLVDSQQNHLAALNTIINAASDGQIPIERIEESVKRILRVKFETGLMTNAPV